MKPKDQSCGNCGAAVKTATPQDLRGTLQCCAHPPQLFAMPVQTPQGAVFAPMGGQPQVQPDAWCAEWRENPAPPLAANH